MKPILGFAALLAWLSHCPDINLHGHDPHHPQNPGQTTNDAGPDETPPCEGDDAAVSGDDGSMPQSEDPMDAAMPPIIDAGIDASDVDQPDAEVEGPVVAKPVPPGQCTTPPTMGLYAEGSNACDDQHLAAGIERYVPRYPLWSDAAVKDRYILLPPGSYIDTTNPDRWSFPVGTILWKTFTAKGLRIETRRLEKTGPGNAWTNWTADVYLWSADGRSATLWDDTAKMTSVVDALGTGHDIPTQADCKNCHGMLQVKNPAGGMPANVEGDGVNGFGAIQLNWDPPQDSTRPKPLTLRELIFRGLLRNGATGAPNVIADETSEIPGDQTQKDALGYLHANCGHCHGGANGRAGATFWAVTGMTKLSKQPVYLQLGACLARWYQKPLVDGPATNPPEVYKWRIKPGDAYESGIIGRMSAHIPGDKTTRLAADQMPKIGTKVVDEDGLMAVSDWINALDPNIVPLADSCPPPPPPMMAAAGSGGTGGAAGSAGSAGSAGMGGSPAPMP
jgi:hypothetical protein